MTCEVVCLNRLGAAICADSAVSLSLSRKAYNGFQKIIPLGSNLPVAFTVFGDANFIGAPWSLLLEEFGRGMGDNEAPHLETYLSRLIAFLESDHPLVSGVVEAEAFLRWCVSRVRPMIEDVIDTHGAPDTWTDEGWGALQAALRIQAAVFDAVTPAPEGGTDSRFTEAYSLAERQILGALFPSAPPPSETRSALLEYLSRREKVVASSDESTGLVIVGYGRDEYFPRCIQLRIGPKLAGRVRYSRGKGADISPSNRSYIGLFAQSEMAEAFLHGMTISAWGQARAILSEVLQEYFDEDELPESARDALVEDFGGRLVDFNSSEYTEPLEEAAAALPVDELASLAHTLVSLAAFRSRLSVTESGSVGGELRVCTITKHQGFRWVRS